MKRFKVKSGFTLIELLIALALVAMIIGTAGTMIVFSIKSQNVVDKEFQIQSDMRIASEIVNQNVRHATAVFMLNEDQYQDSTDLKDGWDYFALSDDNKEIVHYKWNEVSGSHNQISLVQAHEGIYYGLNFKSVLNDARLVEFNLEGYQEGSVTPKVTISSVLNALNSVVVDDAGTAFAPSVSLAYRSEDIPDPDKIKVAVTMVLDKSGSMSWPMDGRNGTSPDIRMTVMKARAKELIDTFADMDNVYVSLIPFSTYGEASDFKHAKTERLALKNQIDGLIASGGTNAGDGVRRSYFKHKTFNEGEADRVLNYTILLMDGEPTYFTRRNSSEHYGPENNQLSLGGNGSTTINESTKYIENLVAATVKSPSGSKPVYMKTFVIGFTAVPSEVTRANNIAGYHSHPTDDRIKGMYYAATSSDELERVFGSIAAYILNETWHIYGPNE